MYENWILMFYSCDDDRNLLSFLIFVHLYHSPNSFTWRSVSNEILTRRKFASEIFFMTISYQNDKRRKKKCWKPHDRRHFGAFHTICMKCADFQEAFALNLTSRLGWHSPCVFFIVCDNKQKLLTRRFSTPSEEKYFLVNL